LSESGVAVTTFVEEMALLISGRLTVVPLAAILKLTLKAIQNKEA
jgi:hypothetical protein